MTTLLPRLVPYFAFVFWIALWALGGVWAVRSAFNLRRNEEPLVGLAFGLALVTLASNLFARWVSLPLAFWLAAGLVGLLGLGLLLPRGWRALYRLNLPLPHLLAFLALAWIFTRIAEGYAIFDDFAHLPTLSLMATGEIPPRFALDPGIPYDYHYFLMVFAAGVMRIAEVFPWRALDIARGLTFALATLLMFVWVQRLTHSRLAGFVGALFLAFASGTRWLLLLLPAGVLNDVSASVTLLGSGLQSGPDLATALVSDWMMEGGGPRPFPFAFANGLFSPAVLALMGVNGLAGRVNGLAVLLTINRWKGWRGPFLTVILISSSGLLGEISLLRSLASWALLSVLVMLTRRSWRLPRSLLVWLGVVLAGQALGLVNGGATAGIISGLISEAMTGIEAVSYQTVGVQFIWPPVMVSSHLGVLSLINLRQLLVLLAELGPVLLALPLLAVFGWKAFRAGRWYETVIVLSAFSGFLGIFVVFSGSTGVRNTSRLYGFLSTAMVFAVPLVWRWAEHRSARIKALAGGLAAMIMLSGAVLFATMLPALQRPVYSSFIGNLDVQAARDYWNRLEPGALVFDPRPSRATALFGRYTRSSTTWYHHRPDWLTLIDQPDPAALRSAGFRYAYLDRDYLEALPQAQQDALRSGCAQVLSEYADWMQDYRLLLDLRPCD